MALPFHLLFWSSSIDLFSSCIYAAEFQLIVTFRPTFSFVVLSAYGVFSRICNAYSVLVSLYVSESGVCVLSLFCTLSPLSELLVVQTFKPSSVIRAGQDSTIRTPPFPLVNYCVLSSCVASMMRHHNAFTTEAVVHLSPLTASYPIIM